MPFNIAFLALNVVVLIWHFAITHRYRLPRGPAWLRLLIAIGIFFLALLASTEFFDLITRSLIPGDAPHNTWCFVYGILLCWLELAMAFTCGCFLIGNGRVIELRIRS